MDRKYPRRPIVGVAGVLFQGDSILLARRAQEPAMGEWSLPGGVVEIGESIEDALKRECLEEVSVEIEPGGLVDIVEKILRDPQNRILYHYIIVEYWCRVVKGVPKASSDVSDIRRVPLDMLGRMDLRGDMQRIILRAIELWRG